MLADRQQRCRHLALPSGTCRGALPRIRARTLCGAARSGVSWNHSRWPPSLVPWPPLRRSITPPPKTRTLR